tara:strand:+ start:6183 stop:6392 length:210 start_codon:yes stop_codon:yes gene_type:complete
MTNELSQEDTLVKQLAAPIIAAQKYTKKFQSRNRSTWKRMNRPCKIAKIEAGALFIDKFLKLAHGSLGV